MWVTWGMSFGKTPLVGNLKGGTKLPNGKL